MTRRVWRAYTDRSEEGIVVESRRGSCDGRYYLSGSSLATSPSSDPRCRRLCPRSHPMLGGQVAMDGWNRVGQRPEFQDDLDRVSPLLPSSSNRNMCYACNNGYRGEVTRNRQEAVRPWPNDVSNLYLTRAFLLFFFSLILILPNRCTLD